MFKLEMAHGAKVNMEFVPMATKGRTQYFFDALQEIAPAWRALFDQNDFYVQIASSLKQYLCTYELKYHSPSDVKFACKYDDVLNGELIAVYLRNENNEFLRWAEIMPCALGLKLLGEPDRNIFPMFCNLVSEFACCFEEPTYQYA